MLTKKQNLIETIKGGNPDRYVNQYEALGIVVGNPAGDVMIKPGQRGVTGWGVTMEWPEGFPGQFPVHDKEHIVIKDIENWREYVHAPKVKYNEEAWEPFVKQAEAIDRNEQFVLPFVAPGIFEQCHNLSEISNCLMYLITNPDEMHDLIKYITDWELELAEENIKYLKPDGVFHHDDWGTQISTFLSPDMFEEFYLEPYKQVYGYYKSHGAELIVHHCDSYAATLVPYMIEMGINIWQGPQSTNNLPELIKKYGDKITFMGGIDSGIVDRPDWTDEHIEEVVRDVCRACGTKYFVPCASQGLWISTYPGVYESVSAAIDKMSKEMFK
jgi:hypothetical protein